MVRRGAKPTLAIFLYLAATASVAIGVWAFALTEELDKTAARARVDLTSAADRLTDQLRQYGEIAVLLSDHPYFLALLREEGDPDLADAVLLEARDKTEAVNITLYGVDGQPRATALPVAPGADHLSGRRDFERALDGALGTDHAFRSDTGRRIYRFAHPVFAPEGPVLGAVVISADVEAVEAGWRGAPTAVFFTDRDGVIFVSNRSELIFLRRNPEAGATALPALRPFPPHRLRNVSDHELWHLEAGRYIPSTALHLEAPMPLLDLTGEVLIDVAPAFRLAWLQALAVTGLLLTLGALLFLAAERRRNLAERLEIEEAAKAALEARVEARTAELSQVNRDLRHEVTERREAEAALRQAQDDLVQAGKLSALGKMSAGISHELNQPLMAIQSFAENSAILIERGRTEAASGNLDRISELARRMGRIIRNLRAFARQERVPLAEVGLVQVVEAALEIGASRIREAGVQIVWHPPAEITVRAGEVRLQQVILNLLSNAIDAMEDSETRRIEIDIETEGAQARLMVRDTGPGIKEPERVFDPFYSTKEVGKSEGMGLGLSISYGLVQSFGGEIRAQSHPGGGAVFTVELVIPELERAA